MNKLNCDGDSHIFYFFAENRQTFWRSVFSAKCFFGEMAFRRSGFRQSVVHRNPQGIQTPLCMCFLSVFSVLFGK